MSLIKLIAMLYFVKNIKLIVSIFAEYEANLLIASINLITIVDDTISEWLMHGRKHAGIYRSQ